MILQNIQCSHLGKNFKLSLVYLGIALLLFYNLQALLLESSEKLVPVETIPQPFLQSRPVVEEDGEQSARPALTERNKTGSQHSVWISMGLCWGENAKVNGKDHFPSQMRVLCLSGYGGTSSPTPAATPS